MRPARTWATRPAIALPVYTGSSSSASLPRRQRHRLAHRVVEPAVARRVHRVGDLDVGGIERRGTLDHGRQIGRHLRHPVALPPGVAPHADAVDRYRLVQRPQPDQEAGVGERAARGADHRVEPDAERPGLRRHLLSGQDVAEPAERRMPGGVMDHVRPAALAGERSGAPLQRCVGRRSLVLAHGERMQLRAEQSGRGAGCPKRGRERRHRRRALRAGRARASPASAQRPRRRERGSTAPPRPRARCRRRAPAPRRGGTRAGAPCCRRRPSPCSRRA